MCFPLYNKHNRKYYAGLNCMSQITSAKTLKYKCWLDKPAAKSVFPKTVATELQISTVGVHTKTVPVMLLMTLFIDLSAKIYSKTNLNWQGESVTKKLT